MLRYVAKVNSIAVIDDNGKNYTVTDEYILEKAREIMNTREYFIQTEKE